MLAFNNREIKWTHTSWVELWNVWCLCWEPQEKNSRTVWGYSVRKTHSVVLVTCLNRTPIIQPLTQKRYSSLYCPYSLLYRERLVNTMHLETSLLQVIISISKAKFEAIWDWKTTECLLFKNKGHGNGLVGKMLVLNLRFNSRTEDDNNEEERKEEKRH